MLEILGTFLSNSEGDVAKEFHASFVKQIRSRANLPAANLHRNYNELFEPLGITVEDTLGITNKGVNIIDATPPSSRELSRTLRATLTPEAFMKLAAAWGYDPFKGGKLNREEHQTQWEVIKRKTAEQMQQGPSPE